MKKHIIFGLWILVIAAALYFYFFRNDSIRAGIALLMSLPLIWRYIIFLVLGCLRGFTLIPVTYLILAGLVFLPTTPAYVFTIIGVMVSATCIYYFSEYLGLASYFEKHYPKQITKLKSTMSKRELPIVILWSFLPITPTDLICYVCGSLRVNFKKFILGVFIGETISCAIYIYAGKELLLLILHRVLGV